MASLVMLDLMQANYHLKSHIPPIFLHKVRSNWYELLEKVPDVDYYEAKLFRFFLNSFAVFSMFLVMAIWIDQI